MTPSISKDAILRILEEVKDPEMKSVSIVELGMLESVRVGQEAIEVNLMPTFSGCPALDMIEHDVKDALLRSFSEDIHVKVSFISTPPWTTDRISEEGREKLKQYGISPPPAHHKEGDPWEIDCPYCGSTYVTMENIFGPTACRSILYCRACKNPFEAMKPIANLNEGESY